MKSALHRATQRQGEGKGMDGRAIDKAKITGIKYSVCPPRTKWMAFCETCHAYITERKAEREKSVGSSRMMGC